MSSRAIRIALTVVIIGGSLGAVMFATLSEDARYYKYVDEVMPQPDHWYGKKLKLHGNVVNPEQRPGTMDYRFTVTRGDYKVVAFYTGFMPDTVKEGSEVVLTGTLGPDGFKVDPKGITGKCPSRYDAMTPVVGGGGGTKY
jgi:cytochrome c-type biogenesis protein CcmE